MIDYLLIELEFGRIVWLLSDKLGKALIINRQF